MLKYWGVTLDEFYKKIRSQKIKYPYEIVVAYYGKDEELYKKIKSLSTTVVRQKPENYNCGRTRDLACKAARGKYIVTVSPDSIPLNNKWLINMIEPLIKGEAQVVQGNVQCPKKGNPNYPDFFYWEKDFGFYFTSEGKEFFKKYGNVSDYGSYGLAAPNLAFTKNVWKNTGFSGVRYNGDNIFQKRISIKHYRALYKDDATVLHAHSYKKIRSLFNRCSNEGLAWADLHYKYDFLTMLKDISKINLHIKAIRAFISGELKYPAEVFFIWIRPFGLFWGSNFAKNLYSDAR
jgi:glycosyltransferase involved in cell wall biosynthesis